MGFGVERPREGNLLIWLSGMIGLFSDFVHSCIPFRDDILYVQYLTSHKAECCNPATSTKCLCTCTSSARRSHAPAPQSAFPPCHFLSSHPCHTYARGCASRDVTPPTLCHWRRDIVRTKINDYVKPLRASGRCADPRTSSSHDGTCTISPLLPL
jgi:hypothetical protein